MADSVIKHCIMVPINVLIEWVAADEAAREVVTRLKALLLEQGMLKRLIGLQGSIVIRTAAYSLLAVLCKR
jgi:hypothetical protein